MPPSVSMSNTCAHKFSESRGCTSGCCHRHHDARCGTLCSTPPAHVHWQTSIQGLNGSSGECDSTHRSRSRTEGPPHPLNGGRVDCKLLHVCWALLSVVVLCRPELWWFPLCRRLMRTRGGRGGVQVCSGQDSVRCHVLVWPPFVDGGHFFSLERGTVQFRGSEWDADPSAPHGSPLCLWQYAAVPTGMPRGEGSLLRVTRCIHRHGNIGCMGPTGFRKPTLTVAAATAYHGQESHVVVWCTAVV